MQARMQEICPCIPWYETSKVAVHPGAEEVTFNWLIKKTGHDEDDIAILHEDIHTPVLIVQLVQLRGVGDNTSMQ